jgi:hypothetical protein
VELFTPQCTSELIRSTTVYLTPSSSTSWEASRHLDEAEGGLKMPGSLVSVIMYVLFPIGAMMVGANIAAMHVPGRLGSCANVTSIAYN